MAEHTLTIKAKLDDSEVRSKIDKLNQGEGTGGSSQSGKDIDKLSSSLNNLKRILGGGAIANSFLNLSESINLFGKEGDKTAQRLKNSVSKVLASIMSGNPVVIATTGLFEALAYQANKLNDQLEKSKKDFEELQKRIATFNDLRTQAEQRDRTRFENSFADNASIRELSEELKSLKSERKSLIFDRDYELSKGGTLGFDPEKVKKFSKQIGELDSTIDKYDAALKRKVDEHLNEIDEDEERRLRFSNAIKSFEQRQEIKSAISRGDEKYLLNQRDLAQRGMTAAQQSNLPEKWEQFRGRFETYQQALEQLWAKQRELAEREVKRAEDLALARADYQDKERSRIASMKGDISYFQNMLEESKRVM